jgi:hypothetical protein
MRYFLAVVAALAFQAAAHAQDNLQNLLAALTLGSEVTLITPLANGMAQVTSFRPAARLSSAEAVAAIERARLDLAAFGVMQPTGEQFALALVGGTVDVPSGRTQLRGVLPQGTANAAIRSQLVSAGSLPQVGGAAPPQLTPGQLAQMLQLANQQLASLGIANPTAEQLSIALSGGVLTTPVGAITLQGVLAAAAVGSAAAGGTAPAPIVSPTPAFPSFSSQTPGFSSQIPGYPQDRR